MKTSAAIQHLNQAWQSPSYVVMVGVPGVGKSTFVKKFSTNLTEKFIIASTDDLIEIEAQKMGLTYSEAFHKVNQKMINRAMDAAIKNAIHAGNSVFHDQTNMGSKKRKTILEAVPNHYFKICLNFSCDDKVLQERLDARAKQTGKVIPPFVLKSMFNSYVAPSKAEGFNLIIEVDNT